MAFNGKAVVVEKDENDDPILDGRFLSSSARMTHRGGSTPLDLLLDGQQVAITQEMMQNSRAAVAALVECGVVSHIVLSLVREFQMAATESQQWSGWIKSMASEGKHLRASVALRWGEYRLQLVRAQRELGKQIMEELRTDAPKRGKGKDKVRSYIPSKLNDPLSNPILQSLLNGQNPLVNGEAPTGLELSRSLLPEERDPETDFSSPDFLRKP